jgi:hypothetical protein
MGLWVGRAKGSNTKKLHLNGIVIAKSGHCNVPTEERQQKAHQKAGATGYGQGYGLHTKEEIWRRLPSVSGIGKLRFRSGVRAAAKKTV